jgi:aminoglycoside phosphotransferase (APT) family kinase protein
MDVPKLFEIKIAQAIGVKPKNLTIRLRKPLDFQSNRLYDIWADGYHFIAKEYLQPKELDIAPLREYKALRLLSPLDIAPKPIYFDPSLDPLVIYEYMEGEMWDRRPPTAVDFTKLMGVWLKINDQPADWLSRGYERSLKAVESEFLGQARIYVEWVRSEFKPGERAADKWLQLLESFQGIIEELSGYVPVTCFCRADPRFANVIQRLNGQLGLVDWEDSGLRDPARDLADIVTHPNQEDLVNWNAWQAFLEPYLAVRSRIDRDISRRMHLYLAIFPFFWLAIISKHGIRLASTGQLKSWNVNGLPGNERLRRYLARAAAWPKMDFGDSLDSLETIVFFPDKSAGHES